MTTENENLKQVLAGLKGLGKEGLAMVQEATKQATAKAQDITADLKRKAEEPKRSQIFRDEAKLYGELMEDPEATEEEKNKATAIHKRFLELHSEDNGVKEDMGALVQASEDYDEAHPEEASEDGKYPNLDFVAQEQKAYAEFMADDEISDDDKATATAIHERFLKNKSTTGDAKADEEALDEASAFIHEKQEEEDVKELGAFLKDLFSDSDDDDDASEHGEECTCGHEPTGEERKEAAIELVGDDHSDVTTVFEDAGELLDAFFRENIMGEENVIEKAPNVSFKDGQLTGLLQTLAPGFAVGDSVSFMKLHDLADWFGQDEENIHTQALALSYFPALHAVLYPFYALAVRVGRDVAMEQDYVVSQASNLQELFWNDVTFPKTVIDILVHNGLA